jgi:hypothetical protein
MGATVQGLDEAVARLRERVRAATQRGAEATLRQVVDDARSRWPVDTGRSKAQITVRPSTLGARLVLEGYAIHVRRRGEDRPAHLELIVDRLDPREAVARIAQEVRGG